MTHSKCIIHLHTQVHVQMHILNNQSPNQWFFPSFSWRDISQLTAFFEQKGERETKTVTFNLCLHVCLHALSLQSCLILCDSMDCSPPGFMGHGFLQARILEWVVMPSSRGSFWLGDQIDDYCDSCITGGSFTTEPPGKPPVCITVPNLTARVCTQEWRIPVVQSLHKQTSHPLLWQGRNGYVTASGKLGVLWFCFLNIDAGTIFLISQVL